MTLLAAGPFAHDLLYVALLFGLFVVPRVLERFRLPTAITSLALGIVAGPGLGLFAQDATVDVLSTLGIVALFLFAGLDVDVADLRSERRTLGQHVVWGLVLVAAGAGCVGAVFGLGVRAALLASLALFTPSAGFILDTLGRYGLSPRDRFWVRSMTIATEIVALALMFVTLQSTTALRMTLAVLVLGGMVYLLPWAFRLFAAAVVPHAPKSEFAFLIMVAAVCAMVTRELGAYYLVGAFVVGMAAQRFRSRHPALASEKMLHAVEAFASVFVPFYFFHAGLRLDRDDFTAEAALVGIACVVVAVPLRLAWTALHRRVALGEGTRASLRIAGPLVPTLVFTLVLAEILRADPFRVPPALSGGLVVYAILTTLLPGFALRAPPPEFTEPQASTEHPDPVAS